MKRIYLSVLFFALATLILANTYTIGTGTSTQYQSPFNGMYHYGWNKLIFTKSQINTAGLTSAGNITGIAFSVSNNPAHYETQDQRVYIRHTTLSSYGSVADETGTGYPNNATFTQVFQGTVYWNVGGWQYIMFNTPFNWNNTNNLEILWENWDGARIGNDYPIFRYTSQSNTMVYKHADTFPTTYGTRTGTRPNVQLVNAFSSVPSAATLVYPANGGWGFMDGYVNWISMPCSYDVYFGTSPTPPYSHIQNGTFYQPSTLLPNTTYYWKIVPRNEAGVAVDCPTWSFTTPHTGQLAESFEGETYPPPGWWMTLWNSRFARAPINGIYSFLRSVGTSPIRVTTPCLDINSTSRIEFYVMIGSASDQLRMDVKYSTDKQTWTNVTSTIAFASMQPWTYYSIDLGSVASSHSRVYVSLDIYSLNSYVYFYMDHIIGPDISLIPPGAVTLTAPADLAINVSQLPTLSWADPVTGGIPAHYDLYLDTSPNPTTHVAQVTGFSYTLTSNLQCGTTYYWKVIPSNSYGAPSENPVSSFTVKPKIVDFPYLVDFGTNTMGSFPLNWSQLYGLYGSSLIYNEYWLLDNWLNVNTSTNVAAKIEVYTDNIYGWLVTPPIDVQTETFELSFDAALLVYAGTAHPTTTNADDRFLVIMSDKPDMSNPTILREWNNTGSSYVYNDIPNTGQNYVIPLTGITGIKYFAFYGESTIYGNGDNDLMVDNVKIRDPNAPPELTLTPSSWDYGDVYLYRTATKEFTIANTGEGSLDIQGIVVSDTDDFYLTIDPSPISLGEFQSTTFTVVFTPTCAGAHNGTVTITDGRAVTEIPLTGNCIDATVTSFPLIESFEGTTFPPYGWINERTFGTGNPGTWDRQTTGTNPVCTPYDGSAMARFNSRTYPMGTICNLISPPLSSTTGADLRVTFRVYRDNGYPSANDKVNLYYNTRPTYLGATLVQVTNRYYAIYPEELVANLWYEYSFVIPCQGEGLLTYLIFEGYSENGNNVFIDDIEVTEVSDTIEPPLTVISLQEGSVQISWDAVTGALSYNVYGSADPTIETSWELIDSTADTFYTYLGTEGYMFFRVTASTDTARRSK